MRIGRKQEGTTQDLGKVVNALTSLYGPAPPPPSTDPFELVLWENVAYLASDERRSEAMDSLRRNVGTSAQQIHNASSEGLAEAVGRGILPATSEQKLRAAAELVIREFNGDLSQVLEGPPSDAKRLLQRFPGIGEPGAEKILLFLRRHPSLAVDSNGLRVMTRLGYCSPSLSYTAAYRVARTAGENAFAGDMDRLTLARHVLRRHGQTVCRRRAPACLECILRSDCPYYREEGGI